mmetsp:Transcript_116049/g.323246  ORF Transcript_116049/g.323246 Transcript_116049/m.323246 type:complete len:308 (+) Transcript_116049:465-1388(+)
MLLLLNGPSFAGSLVRFVECHDVLPLQGLNLEPAALHAQLHLPAALGGGPRVAALYHATLAVEVRGLLQAAEDHGLALVEVLQVLLNNRLWLLGSHRFLGHRRCRGGGTGGAGAALHLLLRRDVELQDLSCHVPLELRRGGVKLQALRLRKVAVGLAPMAQAPVRGAPDAVGLDHGGVDPQRRGAVTDCCKRSALPQQQRGPRGQHHGSGTTGAHGLGVELDGAWNVALLDQSVRILLRLLPSLRSCFGSRTSQVRLHRQMQGRKGFSVAWYSLRILFTLQVPLVLQLFGDIHLKAPFHLFHVGVNV